ncbi:peptidoglycan-binding protein [Clostridiales bacterium FE2011]|nr:peptidoglycan-binding protein [Clostridiales bacterium FE2011]QTE75642.1 peptidoglycan-binding protein [Clostridiales bacterium FE2010]
MNKKIKVFALVMAIMMIFSSIALGETWSQRYHKNVLRRGCGSKNSPSLKPYVKNLQGDINNTGYGYCGAPDGIYGSLTFDGVWAYQEFKDLDIDGIAGNQTKSTLFYDPERY